VEAPALPPAALPPVFVKASLREPPASALELPELLPHPDTTIAITTLTDAMVLSALAALFPATILPPRL
jgi:hypothetical protein